MSLAAAPRIPNLRLWPLFVVAALVISAGIGLRDPWPADEPRFALVAKEMVETGNWLFPHRNGDLYPDKPPLYMWMIAAGYAATGVLRLAFLLPSLMAGLGTLWLVVDLAGRLSNRRAGILSGWALLACCQFTMQARGAQIDAVLCFWTTLGFYGFIRHFLLGPAWRWYFCACAAIGAGIISKGVGFLPLLMLIPYGIVRWKNPRLPRLGGARTWWRWLVGALIAVGVVAAWLVPMCLAVGDDPALRAYRDNILLRQTTTRFANAWHHHEPFWYFIPQALGLWLPLTLMLPWAAPAWIRRLKRFDARTMLTLGSALLILIFFSCSKGKRGVYILPAVPLVVLALAPLLPGLMRKAAAQATALVLLIWICVITAVAAGEIWLVPDEWLSRVQERGLDTMTLSIACGCAAILAAFWCWRERRRGACALVGFLTCGWLLFGWIGVPVLNRINSPAPFMAEISELIGPNGELGMLRWKEQYVLMSPRKIKTFGYGTPVREEEIVAATWLSAGENRWLLFPDDRLTREIDRTQCWDVGFRHGDHWLLAQRSALIAVHEDDVAYVDEDAE